MLAHLFYQMLCHGCSTAQSIYQIVLLQDCLAGWQVWLLKIYYKIFQTQKLRDMVVNGWNTWAGRVEKGCFFFLKFSCVMFFLSFHQQVHPSTVPGVQFLSVFTPLPNQPAIHPSPVLSIHPFYLIHSSIEDRAGTEGTKLVRRLFQGNREEKRRGELVEEGRLKGERKGAVVMSGLMGSSDERKGEKGDERSKMRGLSKKDTATLC